jgi:hypothetical protein
MTVHWECRALVVFLKGCVGHGPGNAESRERCFKRCKNSTTTILLFDFTISWKTLLISLNIASETVLYTPNSSSEVEELYPCLHVCRIYDYDLCQNCFQAYGAYNDYTKIDLLGSYPEPESSRSRDASVQHQGVHCDVCYISPIIGTRYKSNK